MDSNKTCFYEPVDGWEDQIFYVIYYSGVPITDTEIIKGLYYTFNSFRSGLF
ncbi:unnamed protein product [Meloidogyne enterolobii]|uniref:Uncharacterized protein n=1 Tax=Meloidogyne enterolobii TaxID=390850 RepID=A0ACB1AIF4_MELEN